MVLKALNLFNRHSQSLDNETVDVRTLFAIRSLNYCESQLPGGHVPPGPLAGSATVIYGTASNDDNAVTVIREKHVLCCLTVTPI